MHLDISNQANLPTRYGALKIQAFKEGEKEHLAIFTEPLPEIPLVRIHSECLTGDALGSLKCDCGQQLDTALGQIVKERGMLIYLRQEGRDIGLLNKVNAYALQDQGYDTVEANHQLGFAEDQRKYDIVEHILQHFGISKLRLLTNNPRKLDSLKQAEIIERVPLIVESNEFNEGYMKTKKTKLGHLF